MDTPRSSLAPASRRVGAVHLACASAFFVLAGCGLEEIPRKPAARSRPPAVAPTDPAQPDPAPPDPTDDPEPADPTAPPSAPEPSPVGVTIDGRWVAKEDVIVFLHIGHSNMAGRATGPDDLRGFFYDPHPRLWAYRGEGVFVAAREPLAPDDSTDGRAGPGMALLRSALARAASPDTQFVSLGHGHSGTYGGNCAGFRRGGLLYDLVMGPARELVGRVTFGGIFTMLGQSEHRVAADQQRRFAECLAAVASEMRADLDEPDLPFLVGDYEMGINRDDIGPETAFARGIIEQIAMVPARVPRSAVIPTVGLTMEDTHHFDMAGHKGWAESGIELLVQNDWAPWAMAARP